MSLSATATSAGATAMFTATAVPTLAIALPAHPVVGVLFLVTLGLMALSFMCPARCVRAFFIALAGSITVWFAFITGAAGIPWACGGFIIACLLGGLSAWKLGGPHAA